MTSFSIVNAMEANGAHRSGRGGDHSGKGRVSRPACRAHPRGAGHLPQCAEPPQKRIGFRRYQGDAAWLKPDEFEKRACGARASADALVKTVAAGDDNVIAARFKELVDACKACHKEFRKEERGIRRGTRLRRFGAGCKLVSLTSRIVASAVVPVFDVKRGE